MQCLNLNQDELAHVLAGVLKLAAEYGENLLGDSETLDGLPVTQEELLTAFTETQQLIPRIWSLMTPTSQAWFDQNVNALATSLTASLN